MVPSEDFNPAFPGEDTDTLAAAVQIVDASIADGGSENIFWDVNPSAGYYDGVAYFADQDIVTGYGAGDFGPFDSIQKQQLAVLLARISGETLPSGAGALEAAKTFATTNGYMTDGDWETEATREDVVVAMLKLRGVSVDDVNPDILDRFNDAGQVSDGAKPYLAYAVGCGWVNGDADGNLSPTDPANRAQAAVMAYRALIGLDKTKMEDYRQNVAYAKEGTGVALFSMRAATNNILTLRENWQLTDDLDLNVPQDETITIIGNGYHIYEMGGKLQNSGKGTVLFDDTILYPQANDTDAGSITIDGIWDSRESESLMVKRSGQEASSHNHDGVSFDTEWDSDITADTAISASQNIVLTSNVNIRNLTISGSGTVVNLCLNGKELQMYSSSNKITVESGAALNIYNCTDGGTLKGWVASSGEGMIETSGVTNLHAGTLINSGSYGSVILVNKGGELNISGGRIEKTYSYGSYAVYNYAGTVKMTGGTVDGSSNGQGLYLSSYSDSVRAVAEITGGSITSGADDTSRWTIASQDATLTIGGTATISNTGKSEAVYIQPYSYTAETHITGGSITAANNAAVRIVSSSDAAKTNDVYLSGSPVIQGGTGKADIYIDANTSGKLTAQLYATAAADSGSAAYSGGALELDITRSDAWMAGETVVTNCTDTTRFILMDGKYNYCLTPSSGNLVVGKLHTHPICGAGCTHSDASHEAIADWKPVTMGTSYIAIDGAEQTSNTLPAGSYYLNTDLTVPLTTQGEVTLCLNGHKIAYAQTDKASGAVTAAGNGGLNITDCQTVPGSITATANTASGAAYGVYLTDSAALTLWNGEIKATAEGDATEASGIYSKDGENNITLNGGKVAAVNNSTSAAVRAYDEFANGIYLASGHATATVHEGAEVSVEAGTDYRGLVYGIYAGAANTVVMDGGDAAAVNNSTNSSGSKSAVGVKSGIAQISGGEITASAKAGNITGLECSGSGTSTISGGTITGQFIGTASANSAMMRGVNRTATGNLNITGGVITANGVNDADGSKKYIPAYGVYNANGVGKTAISGDAAISAASSTAYGIGFSTNGGTVALSGGTIHVTSPSNSTSNGVYTISQEKCTVELSGAPVFNITNSTSSGDKKAMFYMEVSSSSASQRSQIKLTGELTNAAPYTVYTSKEGTDYPFTSGWSTNMTGKAGSDYFASVYTSTTVLEQNGELYVGTPHTHSWGYTASGSTVTAACSEPGCPNSSGGSVTITAPANLVCDGSAKAAALTGSFTTGETINLNIRYYSGESAAGTPLGSAPAAAGTYTAAFTAGGATASVTYTVSRGAAAVTTPPAAKTGLTYTGEAQELVTAGSAQNGTMQYSLDQNSWSTAIPTGISADTYVVYYKAATADAANYGDSAVGSVSVDIGKGTQAGSVSVDEEKVASTNTSITIAFSNVSGKGPLQYAIFESGQTPSIQESDWKNAKLDGDNRFTISELVRNTAYDIYFRFGSTDNYNASSQLSTTFTGTTTDADQITISYDKNGAAGSDPAPASHTIDAGQKITPAAKPADWSKSGHHFGGWSENQDGSDPVYQPGEETSASFNSGKVLYAVWLPNNLSITRNGETVYYTDLDEAIHAAQDGDTIKVEQSFTSIGNDFFTQENITLDMNSQSITGGLLAVQSGSLTVTGGGTLDYYVQQVGGCLTLESGTFGALYYVDGDSTIIKKSVIFTGLDLLENGTSIGVFSLSAEEPVDPAQFLENGKKFSTEKIADRYEDSGHPEDSFNYIAYPGPVSVTTSTDSSSSSGKTYSITVNQAVGGKITASAKTSASGKTITLQIEADEGYELGKLTVTDSNGSEPKLTNLGDGKYSFQMPAGKVNVSAVFLKADHDCPSGKYTDVNQSLWYHESIDYVIENGLMVGTSDTTFAPEGTTNRAMVAMILYRLEGSPTTSGMAFEDVADGRWYADAIAWASANNIMSGYGGGTFGPEDPITREQMAATLYRYAAYKGYDVTKTASLSGYSDAASISAWAVQAMAWANAEGLVNGYDNALMPTHSALRSEVAAILMRFCENAAK